MKLPKDKLEIAIEASIDSGAIGVQTGNGFGEIPNGNHILELRSLIKNRCSIKAVGGIKSLNKVFELLNAGASSIGTSVGAELAKEYKSYSMEK